MEQEIWKDIAGYEGKYMVSNLGRVKSLNYRRTGREEILKPNKVSGGYLKVTLCKKGEKYYHPLLVHRLVLEAFVPNPNNLPEVNHKDKNPENNRLENLEWISHPGNIDYSLSKKVLCVETGELYISAMEAFRQTGVHQQHIIACCRGKFKTAKSLHWQYVD